METHSDFEDYLLAKLIDSAKFQSAEPNLYQELAALFHQIHPDSFTAQKLYLINPIRRKYQLEVTTVATPDKPKKVFKPKIK